MPDPADSPKAPRQDRYGKAYARVCRHLGSTAEVAVYTALTLFADDAGECWPSRAALAEHARCSITTVARVLRSLEAKGLIERQAQYGGQGQTASRYVIHDHSWPALRLVSPVDKAGDNPGAPAAGGGQIDPGGRSD